VSQGAFIFPLAYSPETTTRLRVKSLSLNKKKTAADVGGTASFDEEDSPPMPSLLSGVVDAVFGTSNVRAAYRTVTSIDGRHLNPQNRTILGARHPILLTLHGTGLSAGSQADAYKMMVSGVSDEYAFGVEGCYVIAPTRHGAHNWEAIGALSAIAATESLRNILTHFPALPQIHTQSPTENHLPAGIIAGHSMGGHGAWQLAVNNPDMAVCTASAASWIRKEDYGRANAFFGLDVQNTIMDPQLKRILEQSMMEFHVDRMVSNLRSVDVNIRVGMQDFTTHPWHSRRMHRLLQRAAINSTLEELPGKQHWWWDTHTDNDGGALNDSKMRQFYTHCLGKYHEQLRAVGGATVERTELGKKAPEARRAAGGSSARSSHDTATKCSLTPATLTVISPASHAGLCGLRILSQFRYQQLSTVNVDCHSFPLEEYEKRFRHSHNQTLHTFVHATNAMIFRCVLKTSNVRSLLINMGNGGFFANYASNANEKEAVEFLVDGSIITVTAATENSYICWVDGIPQVCNYSSVVHLNPLHERGVHVSGPVRNIYSQRWLVVYGTPQHQYLRLAMRDLAVYIANSNFAAHDTHVRVLSDLEYRAGNYDSEDKLANVMMVGGPTVNKVMRRICKGLNIYNGESVTTRTENQLKTNEMLCRSTFGFHVAGDDVEDVDAELMFTSVGPHRLPAESDVAAIFSFPLARIKHAENLIYESGIGVCLHATSPQGFLHLSRLAWPVVPPMVRSPFANYIPDYMVIDGRVWRDGMGGVKLAGFWNAQWEFDADNVYVASS
jgi:uncharacterized protein (DUF1786 family)